MYSLWVMPFEDGKVLTAVLDSARQRRIEMLSVQLSLNYGNASAPKIYSGLKQFLMRRIAFLTSKKARDVALKG